MANGDFLFTKSFWKDATVRAVKTFAQSAVAVVAVNGTGLLTVDWVGLGSVAGLAALVSILTSISSGDTIGGTTTAASAATAIPATGSGGILPVSSTAGTATTVSPPTVTPLLAESTTSAAGLTFTVPASDATTAVQ